MDFEFISEAVKRFDEDDTIKPAFITAVEELSAQLSEKNINDDYKPYSTVWWLPGTGVSSLKLLTKNQGLEKSCSSCIDCFRTYRVFHLQCLARSGSV